MGTVLGASCYLCATCGHGRAPAAGPALTEPKRLLTWWGDDAHYRCTTWELDLKVGGRWHCEGKNAAGQVFTVAGAFVEIDPPRILSYTWKPSWVEVPETCVRIVLEPRAGGTQLTWTHSGFLGYPKALEDHRGGLPTVVAWLKAFLERAEGEAARRHRPEGSS